MKREYINIVLAADDNYAQHACVLMESIFYNARNKNKIQIYLLSDNISNEKIKLIEESVEKIGGKIFIIDLKKTDIFNEFYTSGHISKTAYARLEIPDALPIDVERVIYLDTDLIVLDDIEKLWNINIGEYPIAGVADYGILGSKRWVKEKKNNIGLNFKTEYFNSGVLIINLKQWRKNNLCKKLFEVARKNNFSHHDQDVLNKVFMNNWYKIPLRWNVIPPVYYLHWSILLNNRFRKQAVIAKKEIAILHYAGSYKPWEFKKNDLFNKDYYYYLSMTEFKNAKMPQKKKNKNIKSKSILRKNIKLRIANFITNILYTKKE